MHTHPSALSAISPCFSIVFLQKRAHPHSLTRTESVVLAINKKSRSLTASRTQTWKLDLANAFFTLVRICTGVFLCLSPKVRLTNTTLALQTHALCALRVPHKVYFFPLYAMMSLLHGSARAIATSSISSLSVGNNTKAKRETLSE